MAGGGRGTGRENIVYMPPIGRKGRSIPCSCSVSPYNKYNTPGPSPEISDGGADFMFLGCNYAKNSIFTIGRTGEVIF